jgi:hypothetical protein
MAAAAGDGNWLAGGPRISQADITTAVADRRRREALMKAVILEFSDSNMAGYEWSWVFSLTRGEKGSVTLLAEQRGGDSEDEESKIVPVRDLSDGADLYEALEGMLQETGYDILDMDLASVEQRMASIAPKLLENFRRAPEILKLREEERRNKDAQERDLRLAPFRERIDTYLSGIEDRPLRYPGGAGYVGSRRSQIKAFIENHVVRTRELPKGMHAIKLNNFGFGHHDFGDFA